LSIDKKFRACKLAAYSIGHRGRTSKYDPKGSRVVEPDGTAQASR
jgi:hypothetical protein